MALRKPDVIKNDMYKSAKWKNYSKALADKKDKLGDKFSYNRDCFNFSEWKRNQIIKEVERRDKDWVWEGKVPSVEYEEGAKPKPHEKATAKFLSKKGFKVLFRPESLKDGVKTSDVYFVVENRKKQIEFKSPEGNGKQNIFHQFESAVGRSRDIVIDFFNIY